ncbi:MAG: nucleotidyltransferase domain-containing protein [bacterium]
MEKAIILDRYVGYKIISKEDNEAAIKQILNLILSYFQTHKTYNLNKIIFFGSRRRGDYKWDSDFDFLVIVNEDITYKERDFLHVEILDKISKKRYKGEFLDVELIVSGLKTFTKAIDYTGHILRYAYKEGVVLYDKILQSENRMA